MKGLVEAPSTARAFDGMMPDDPVLSTGCDATIDRDLTMPATRLPLRRPAFTICLGLCLSLPITMAGADEPAPTSPATEDGSSFDRAGYAAMVQDAAELVRRGKAGEAIAKDLDPVIAAYAARYDHRGQTLYSSRSPAETLAYLLSSSTSGTTKAVALDAVWGYALYLKGFALIELHRIAEARAPLERAVELAPMNSQFLSELAQLGTYEKQWDRSLALFRRAADAAESSSPPASKTTELTRAWRGIAYIDVELGRLDEAATYYDRCLALDPQDVVAKRELDYVRGLRTKAAERPATDGE